MEDLRPNALPNERQPDGIHDVAEMVALRCNPLLDVRLGTLHVEGLTSTQDLDQLRELCGAVLTPTLLAGLLVVLGRRDEEVIGQRPEFGHKADALLHQPNHLLDIRLVGVRNAMTFEHRAEHVSDVAIAAQLDITMVEPLAFLVIELGAALAAMGEVEEADHLVEGHQFDVVAGVPPKQREEVDHGLRQVATLAVAR